LGSGKFRTHFNLLKFLSNYNMVATTDQDDPMVNKEKLRARLVRKPTPKDITWNELRGFCSAWDLKKFRVVVPECGSISSLILATGAL
jgi:hypothetical protein